MKLKLYVSSLLLCISFVGLWEGATSAAPHLGGQPVSKPTKEMSVVPGYLPTLDWTFSNLDVRDAQNGVVDDASAKADLATLFVDNLFRLITVEPPHALREAWQFIEFISRLLHNAFLQKIEKLLGLVQAAWQTASRRLVHNVGKLWISFSDGAKLGFSTSSTFPLSRSPQRLILRC